MILYTQSILLTVPYRVLESESMSDGWVQTPGGSEFLAYEVLANGTVEVQILGTWCEVCEKREHMGVCR